MEYLENEHAFEELQETRANDVDEIVEPNKCEPVLGMLFDNHEEMFAFYKAYGKQEGFPVKVRSTKKGTDGIVKYATFACGRSGKSESKSANALKSKPIVKNGCDAKIGGCLNEDGKWVLRTLNLQHNHGLSPDKARYFLCNRRISASAKKRIEMNNCAGIRIAQNFNSIVVGAGGYENVPFLEKDCRNFVDKTRRLQLEEGDAMALLKYFQKKQAECNGFFFSIDLDEEDRLKNVFWADSRSRAAYKYFGDVITFDTTYLINKYDMPFAPFAGVNHHGQSILLGCGLISCEDTETFTWLFEAWLSCMSDSPPLSIITDQDRAMQKAIENIFPTTRHRWCLWHIMKKVPEKLAAFKEREGIISSLLSAVYDSLSFDAFEEAWHCMITEYDLWDNDWLNGLYEERHRWVPCYLKGYFWAGMSTTQRSESMNAFFNGFVNSKTNLKQFVKQYENALRRKAELEWQADAKCFSKRTPCVSRYEMERQVEEVKKDMKKMCNAFSEVADITSDDENNYKTVLDWIEKAMKDLPKQIRCESVGKTNTGGASCSSNKQINSESVERTVIGEDLQQTAPSSYHVPNEIFTQGSNIATTLQEGSTIYENLNQCGTMGYYNVPMYQSQFGGSNIYQPFPYNWHPQPVPPYTSQLHYSSPSMTYQGSQSENFQQLLQQQQQQRYEGNIDDT
ncbi:protein FAR1-RELATED SEQUENCE [Citrus sinensis]|uniref:Protein FAR1-RELATED SEQUENCE n=1 Tax=Citrus sinensis TaxID=2711 RepID=A0ACB8JNX0_CITSI|nr:protein FAR1-RELATED SEQUENCE [Citrus sinensis]